MIRKASTTACRSKVHPQAPEARSAAKSALEEKVLKSMIWWKALGAALPSHASAA